jgi:hypothetical protein
VGGGPVQVGGVSAFVGVGAPAVRVV